MDEGTGEVGKRMNESRGPEEIRRDIEQTREELGDTVAALAQKADVKGQAKERVSAARESIAEKKDEFVSRARGATPESASEGAKGVASTAQENPVPVAIAGGFIVGFLLGRITRR